MKIGTKIIATDSEYATSVPNGTIMTVTHVFESGQVNATIDGGDGFEWYLFKGTFEEHTPKQQYAAIKDLNLKAGDVVGYKDASYLRWTFTPDGRLKGLKGNYLDGSYFSGGVKENDDDFYIVSRVAPDQVTPATPALPYGHATMPDGRVVDLTANRVRCDLMDLDELEAMQDHGGPWEWWDGEWIVLDTPAFRAYGTYRVAPKPVVRAEVMYTNINTDSPWGLSADSCPDDRTHKITLTIKDGDVIDTKTEKL